MQEKSNPSTRGGGRLLVWDLEGHGEDYPARGWGSSALIEVPVPSLGSDPDPATFYGTSGSLAYTPHTQAVLPQPLITPSCTLLIALTPFQTDADQHPAGQQTQGHLPVEGPWHLQPQDFVPREGKPLRVVSGEGQETGGVLGDTALPTAL